MRTKTKMISACTIFLTMFCLQLTSVAVDYSILFKGSELRNSNGGFQGAEIWARGYVNGDTSVDMLSAGTYDVVTTWAQGNPRNLYGTVTIDANGEISAVTGALVAHDSKTVGFDISKLTAITVNFDTIRRGYQEVLMLGVNGFHNSAATFYLPDGTYYPATGWLPGHAYYGTFTVGGGGVVSTSGAMTLTAPGVVDFDLASLTHVRLRADLNVTANGVKMRYGISGVGIATWRAPDILELYLPDASYSVVTGWGPGHHLYGSFQVSAGTLSSTGAIYIDNGNNVIVDQSQLNAIKVTPIGNFIGWSFVEQTREYTDDSTVDIVYLPNGGYRAAIRMLDSSLVYSPFSVTDGALDETLLPVGDPLIELSTNTDPVADAGLDQEIECESSDGASVTLDASNSFDVDGDILEYQWSVPEGITLDDDTSATPSGTFPPGITLATLTVTDGQGGVSIDDVEISVVDTTPPEVSCTTNKGLLWPPNHQMEAIDIFVIATDNCSNPEDLILIEVTISSSEPDDAQGNGDGATVGDVDFEDGYSAPVDVTSSFAYDIVNEGFAGQVMLRAERDGGGDGRTYTITAKLLDSSNNLATTSCVVVVPHDRRGKK